MSHRLRALLICRHFWPHGSFDSAGFWVQLVAGLHRRGIHVEVVTPRYAASWPDRITFREITVHRPVAAPKGDWSVGRYIRHLASWLRENGASFDVLFADSAREESIAAVEAAQALRCRSMVRVAGHGRYCDMSWWMTSRAAKRCANVAKQADCVVVSSASSHRQLLQSGIAASKITRVNVGFPGGVARSASARQQARQSLANVNLDLEADDDTLVVLCVGRMTQGSGGDLLSQAARHLIARYPDLKLWFVGDGPHRDSMYELMRGDGVRASIAMPGSFCDLNEVFAAADIFVQADLQGLDFLLPNAVSAELPVVVIDDETTRQTLGISERDSQDERAVTWIETNTAKAVRVAVVRGIKELQACREGAEDLRKQLVRARPLDQTIDQYAELIRQTVSRGTRGNDASMGAVS